MKNLFNDKNKNAHYAKVSLPKEDLDLLYLLLDFSVKNVGLEPLITMIDHDNSATLMFDFKMILEKRNDTFMEWYVSTNSILINSTLEQCCNLVFNALLDLMKSDQKPLFDFLLGLEESKTDYMNVFLERYILLSNTLQSTKSNKLNKI